MEIRLHANATTTPKQRAYIQRSARPAAELAVEIGVSEHGTQFKIIRTRRAAWRRR